MRSKLTVLQIIPELSAGGAEQGCLDIAQALVEQGANAIVASNGGNRIHELDRMGANHINMPVHSKNPFTILKNIKRLQQIIAEHKVDIVHARSRAPAWSAWRACMKTKTPFVTTCHAPYNFEGELKRFYNSVITKADRVIAISHMVGNYLLNNYRMDDQKIRVIHNGIALEKFHPTTVTPQRLISLSQEWRVPDGAYIIMLPARLTRWKGHHILIDAIAQLDRKDIFCVLIGDDQGRKTYRQELEQKIKDQNLGARIRIVNHCNDMPAAYMLANVVVSASTDPEGFGRIPVEAQAMGRPVVASDHGGAQETIVRGQTGWLFEPGNPKALATVIEEALALTDSQRAILATRAMSHIAENFTKEQMAEKTLSVYQELLQKKQGWIGNQNRAQYAQEAPQNYYESSAKNAAE